MVTMVGTKTWRQHPLLKPLKKLIPNKSKIPDKGTDISLLDYTGKVRYKMAHDRRPQLSQWADKVAVREYVSEKIGSKYLNELYIATKKVEDIKWKSLPREFAFKPSHGSGAGIFVRENADVQNNLPTNTDELKWINSFHIHPDKVEIPVLRDIGSRWLQMRYENFHPWYEWVYEDIQAQLIVEKYATDSDGNPPTNFLIYTFHGSPAYIIIANVFSGFRVMVTPEWEHIAVKSKVRNYASREYVPPRPENLGEMLSIAKTLSGGVDFVRVDLYNDGQKILFGEMTNYPGGGRSGPYSKKFDRIFSSYWKHFDGY